MTRAIARPLYSIAIPYEGLRSLIVCSCAVALIAAGDILPFWQLG